MTVIDHKANLASLIEVESNLGIFNMPETRLTESGSTFVTVDVEFLEQYDWDVLYASVVKCEENGQFYRFTYRVGATQNQDYTILESGPVVVEPVEVTKTVYKPISIKN